MNFAQFKSNNWFILSNLEVLNKGLVCARKWDFVMILKHFFCKITIGLSTDLNAEPQIILQYAIYGKTSDR